MVIVQTKNIHFVCLHFRMLVQCFGVNSHVLLTDRDHPFSKSGFLCLKYQNQANRNSPSPHIRDTQAILKTPFPWLLKLFKSNFVQLYEGEKLFT